MGNDVQMVKEGVHEIIEREASNGHEAVLIVFSDKDREMSIACQAIREDWLLLIAKVALLEQGKDWNDPRLIQNMMGAIKFSSEYPNINFLPLDKQ